MARLPFCRKVVSLLPSSTVFERTPVVLLLFLFLFFLFFRIHPLCCMLPTTNYVHEKK